MRHLIWLGLAMAACSTSPDAPTSYAQFSASADVHAARADEGFISYGAPYHRWTITLAPTQGCGSTETASVELITLSSDLAIPTGTVTIRPDVNTVVGLPSAYVRYMGAPVLSGSVTIDTADPFYISGSWTAMMTIGGAPTEVTAAFGAVVCK